VELLGKYAWYSQNSKDRAWPCGRLLPNELGLFDMLGNIYEWCQQRYYRYPEREGNTIGDEIDIVLTVKEQDPRLRRGGAFSNHPAIVRSSNRGRSQPLDRNLINGFRPSRTYH
jgi:formylglycine-generating enzyme required for sulfatase activity